MLASAPLHYSSDFNLELVLISSGIIAVAALLGFVPIQLARWAKHRRLELIIAVMILWTSVLSLSVCWFVVRQYQFNTSVQQNIMEGYYDPQDQSDKPQPLVALWSGLGVCYAGLLFWANRK
jgi:hypothetical protein